MNEPGPYIYRKPIGGEVLEHPFRVPTKDDCDKYDDENVVLAYLDEQHPLVTEHLDDPGWQHMPIGMRGFVEGGPVVWMPLAPPPPELLELAEKVREESANCARPGR